MSERKRKAISKGLRFDIFRRDEFTCQYCGSQPPDVVLEIDHIMPVKEGGDNHPLNLVTACEACNRGKAAKVLSKHLPRPDADLAFLEMQQELAELRRYQKAKRATDALRDEIVALLQESWFATTALGWCPSESAILKMLVTFEPHDIESALSNVAVKVAGGYLNRRGWERYTWAILRNKAKETGDG